MPINLTSNLDTNQPYIPIVSSTMAPKLGGVAQVFTSVAALKTAVDTEKANIAATLPVWVDGQTLTVTSESAKGVTRVWSTSAQHARTAIIPPGISVVLAGDLNAVLFGSGAPSSGTGSDGDISVDRAGNAYYTKTAGSWALTGTLTAASGGASVLGPYATTSSLPSASTNSGVTALIGASAPYTVYQSDGSSWYPQLSAAQSTAIVNSSSAATLTLTYDGSNRVSTSSRVGGRAYTFQYPDPTHIVIQATSPPSGSLAEVTVTLDSSGRFIGASGNFEMAGASPGASAYPTWRASQPAMSVVQVPASGYLSDLDPTVTTSITPAGSNWVGRGMTLGGFAWTSAVVDQTTGDLHFPILGGHTDYGGNDSYKLRTTLNTPTWNRLRLPSGAVGGPVINGQDGQEATAVYSDGNPRAVHSYNNEVWVPGIGPVLTRMVGPYVTGVPDVKKVFSFDPVAGTWTFRLDYSSLTGMGTGEGCSEYDPVRDVIWTVGQQTSTLVKIDGIRTGTWTASKFGATDNWIKSSGFIRLCPTLDVLVMWPGNNGHEVILRSPTVAGTVTYPTVTGSFSSGLDLTSANQPGAGFTWCDDLNCFLIWHQPNGQTLEVSTLTPPATLGGTWVKGYITFTGTAPSLAKADGTYGRFNYVKKLNGVILVNKTTEKPYFFATA